MKWAIYDLYVNSPSYDFVTFANYAKHFGADAIWFRKGFNRQREVYGSDEAEKIRVQTIILPMCGMFGFKWAFNEGVPPAEMCVWPTDPDQQGACHRFRWLCVLDKGPCLPKIPQESLDRANDRFKGKRPILVIERKAGYEPTRESGSDWRKWAADHEAYVLRDFAEDPIPLEDRFACYELASLNIGVNSGVMAPNYFSHRPYLALKWQPKNHKSSLDGYLEKKHKFPRGSQMPWATKAQKMVWNSDDDYETIEREFKLYMEANGPRLS